MGPRRGARAWGLAGAGGKRAGTAWIADLRGEGGAAVARDARVRGQQVVADYLEVRRNLVGMMLMIDSRLGFTDLDRQLLDFVGSSIGNGSVKLLVLLTKADKLTRSESAAALSTAQKVLGELATDEADVGVALFSALKKIGVADPAGAVHRWAGP